jgi:hypothetical protein
MEPGLLQLLTENSEEAAREKQIVVSWVFFVTTNLKNNIHSGLPGASIKKNLKKLTSVLI